MFVASFEGDLRARMRMKKGAPHVKSVGGAEIVFTGWMKKLGAHDLFLATKVMFLWLLACLNLPCKRKILRVASIKCNVAVEIVPEISNPVRRHKEAPYYRFKPIVKYFSGSGNRCQSQVRTKT